MAILKEILTEKLRPKKLEDVLLVNRVKKIFQSGELSQSILIHGSPGMGKSTLGKIFEETYDTLFINVSLDRGIDTVREEIMDFISTKSLDLFENKKSEMKLVFLDEIDGATENFYKGLRGTMEMYMDRVRFFATCNYINKIPEPMQSRFLVVDINPKNEEETKELMDLYKTRILKVTNKLNLTWDDGVIDLFLQNYFPDMRTIFQKIQEYYNSEDGKITLASINKLNTKYIQLFDICLNKPDPINNFKMVMGAYGSNLNEVFSSFSNEFPLYMEQKNVNLTKLAGTIMTIAEWDYKRTFLIEPQLALLAMIFNIQQVLNS